MPVQRASTEAPASAPCTLPPGNTIAPAAKSMRWWRTTMKTSSPAAPSRTRSTVAAGTGWAGLGIVCSLSGADQPADGWAALARGTSMPRKRAMSAGVPTITRMSLLPSGCAGSGS